MTGLRTAPPKDRGLLRELSARLPFFNGTSVPRSKEALYRGVKTRLHPFGAKHKNELSGASTHICTFLIFTSKKLYYRKLNFEKSFKVVTSRMDATDCIISGGFFLSGFLTKIPYKPLLPHTCYMPQTIHSFKFYQYKIYV